MSLNTRTRVIVAIQIAGSAYATINLLIAFPGFDSGTITLLPYSVPLAASVFGFASGLLFWAGKTVGYFGSIATHALQIPMIVTTVLSYRLSLGIGVFLQIIDPGSLFGLTFGASTILAIMPQQHGTVVAVNLYALSALVYLIRDWKHAKKQSKRATP